MSNRMKKVFIYARDLLINKGWCQFALARTAQGEETCDSNKNAVSFCAVGALGRAKDDLDETFYLFKEYLYNLHAASPGEDIITYNNADTTTKEDVIAVFNKVIDSIE